MCVLGTRLGSGYVCSGYETRECVCVFWVRDLGVSVCVLGTRLGSGCVCSGYETRECMGAYQ